MNKRRIYMAGKIEKGDWREGVYGRGHHDDLYNQLANTGRIQFPVIEIDDNNDYTGPYFVGCDHGCFHGEATHGVGARCECGKTWSTNHFHECPDCGMGADNYCTTHPTQENIFQACRYAIMRETTTFFAWVDTRECYGTIAEIGIACTARWADLGTCEELWIASPDIDPELWFIRQMATDFTVAKNPHEALDYFLKKHTKIDYHEYIKSDVWRARAISAKERAEYRCQVCNATGNNSTLHAHHRTYERLGMEEPGDITVLCADCHKVFHDNGKVKRNG